MRGEILHVLARRATTPHSDPQFAGVPRPALGLICVDAVEIAAGDGDDDVEPINDLQLDQIGTSSRRLQRLDLRSHSGSLEAAGTIPDAVWRKVRCFSDPAASTMSPRTGRFLGVSRGLVRTGSVVASDGAITTCDHNSHAVSWLGNHRFSGSTPAASTNLRA